MKKFNGVEQVTAADRNAGGYELGKGGTAEMNRKLNAFLDNRGLVRSFRPAFAGKVKAAAGKVKMPATPVAVPVAAPADETPAAAASEPATQPAAPSKKRYRPVIDPALVEIGLRIKAVLVARGITQRSLSGTLGYKAPSSVSLALAGYTLHGGPRERICEALNLDAEGYPSSRTAVTAAATPPEPPPVVPSSVEPPVQAAAPEVLPLPTFDLAAIASATAALHLTLLDYAFAKDRFEEATRALRAARIAAEKVRISIDLPEELLP